MLFKDNDETFYKRMTKLYRNAVDIASHSTKQDNRKSKKIYFAGPWFSNRDMEIYDFCMNAAYITDTNYKIYFPREHSEGQGLSPKETFISNLKEISAADIVVALVSTKDVGTAFEIGYAHSLSVPIILLVYDESDIIESKTNLMLAMCASKIFELNEWVNFLLQDENVMDFIEMEDSWEAIE